MLKKLRQRVLISIVLAGAVYLAFTIYANFTQVLQAFGQFNWLLLPLLLLLSFMNYFARFLKWDYYLSIVHVEMKKVDSLSTFMSGLIMSVTPAKLGEVLKSVLVKEITGVPISKTAPIILAERITDFLSLLIIAITGAFFFDYGGRITIIVAVFIILLILAISNKKIALPIINFAEKIPFIKKYIHNIHSAYESSYQLLKPKPLIQMTLFSLIAWGFECFGYYIILINFNVNFGILWAFFSYSFSTIIGAISMLPGGLGLTEGSLTFLLVEKHVSTDIAVATTFIIRVVTLWFAVLVGIVSLTIYQKRYGKIKMESL
ncbi:MAG: flippase-like domain-containing protein [Ignavibacteriaceae bacterium]|nr:flippase-like domain-containing protein [Ignavibacteriaceae bacterium]MCW8814239.1 flippase-like domain-containing protein [Chlorobium sp.]MCW8817406.1 flippase-like domain-containing protein [Ignavibacteriaceae bacterium]MCW8961635.1 flippase-like domain-containing protein [Ignavibacteriaceae bacterium]MCW9094228.1 flippase-like domain-containing protein [Ignavibacteriaceae bacterium]